MIKKTFKSIKFKKLFLIPYGIWFLLTIIAMIPDASETDPLTWDEFIVANLAMLILWFVISFIISYIIMLVSNKITKVEKVVTLPVEINDDVEIKEQIKESKNDEIKKLYTCESIINASEYGKMAQYFPRFYWSHVFYDVILNLIFTSIWAISTKSLVKTLLFCIIYQLIIMLENKLRLRKIAEKTFIRLNKKGTYDSEYLTEFYDEFFIRKGKNISRRIFYNEINRYVETETNIFLSVENKNIIIILQKEKCNDDLIKFINKKIEKDKKCISRKNNIKVLKKPIKKDKRVFMIILFIVTILSIYGALFTYGLIGVVSKNTYGFNIVKYMWIFWLWLPIPILSIILGFKYKKQGLKCTKNIVAGFIIGVLLLIYGSFSFIFKDFNDYTNSIFVITQDEYNKELKYYEVNYKSNIRSIDKFESNVEDIYTIHGCFTGLDDKLTFEKCEVKGRSDIVVQDNELLKDILINISKIEDSWVSEVKILKIKESYFVVTRLNVNLWTPYVLYQYNLEKKELTNIFTFSNADVVGIKQK